MLNIFAIYKPKGPSSFRMISLLRKQTGVKKIGHAGTLDPLASGVLVVGVGREATRELHKIVAKDKEYLVTVKLGMTSTTDDEAGTKTIIAVDQEPELAAIKKIIPKYIGVIEQVPPQFSAIKISGQRAYDVARKGETVEFRKREVRIDAIEIIDYEWPLLKLKVKTGPGAYIRSLARDIGEDLKCGGYVTELERTRVGEFGLAECVEIDKIERIG
ncbi:MAG: tRNA pseudouridine(55) synthase TruB [Candidatus Buchananbacteria bacterium]|nr:tRNA pseudouridine(55) synthase TruB [Candidatus Buchananbacteria bacterium]